MEDLISVIVPVYNVEKYLPKCIESILNQTYRNLQIILVDDGSSDNCGKICDEYAKQDKRINVIHKTNGGISDARNSGLNAVTGRYIAFVDSDDYVDTNYVELLIKVMRQTKCDIAVSGVKYAFENGEIVDKNSPKESIITYSQKEAIRLGLKTRLRQGLWGKLYKTEVFQNIQFPVGKIYEDLAVFYSLLLSANKVSVITNKTYYYLIRNKSIMHSKFNPNQLVEIEIIEQQMKLVAKKYPEFEKQINARKVCSYFVVLKRILTSENPDSLKKERNNIKEKIKQYEQGLLLCKDTPMQTKLKLLAYFFGENAYLFIQKIADKKNPEIMSQ